MIYGGKQLSASGAVLEELKAALAAAEAREADQLWLKLPGRDRRTQKPDCGLLSGTGGIQVAEIRRDLILEDLTSSKRFSKFWSRPEMQPASAGRNSPKGST